MLAINRRRLTGACLGALALGGLARPASAQAEDDNTEFEGMASIAPLPQGFRNGIGSPEFSFTSNFGDAPPPAVYVDIANALLQGAPTRCRPIDVAYYFEKLREGDIPAPTLANVADIARRHERPALGDPNFLRFFAYDWEQNRYYNPVVIHFITGIHQSAYKGDATPWCAAFANWCISRSQATNPAFIDFNGRLLRLGTASASSGSFRCWGEPTSSPQEGDIVVWAQAGTENQNCPIDPNHAQGHVGFLSELTTAANGRTRYIVVGGNQNFSGQAPAPGQEVSSGDIAQAVSRRPIGRNYGDRVFHSVRTSPLLRRAP